MKNHGTPSALEIVRGQSFGIPELLIAQAWAEFHDLRLTVELGNVIDGEEFEEVLSFYRMGSSFRRWMIWRENDGVILQPAFGPASRFDSLCDALDGCRAGRSEAARERQPGATDAPAAGSRPLRAKRSAA